MDKNITMDNFWIIITWVVVFIIGQIIQKFILEPLQEYKKMKGKIFNSVKLYSAQVMNKSIRMNPSEFNMLFRELASEFESAYYMVPRRCYFICLKFIIKEEDMYNVCGWLYWISNSVFDKEIPFKDIKMFVKNIEDWLNMKIIK